MSKKECNWLKCVPPSILEPPALETHCGVVLLHTLISHARVTFDKSSRERVSVYRCLAYQGKLLSARGRERGKSTPPSRTLRCHLLHSNICFSPYINNYQLGTSASVQVLIKYRTITQANIELFDDVQSIKEKLKIHEGLLKVKI